MNPKDSDQIFESVPFTQINPSHDFDEKVFNYFNPRIFTNKNNEVKYTQEEIDFMKQSRFYISLYMANDTTLQGSQYRIGNTGSSIWSATGYGFGFGNSFLNIFMELEVPILGWS